MGRILNEITSINKKIDTLTYKKNKYLRKISDKKRISKHLYELLITDKAYPKYVKEKRIFDESDWDYIAKNNNK